MDTFDKLDRVDLQILRTLQENARLTTKELAARVSLSSTPVFERLKRLESGDRKSTRLNSSHSGQSRMPSSA